MVHPVYTPMIWVLQILNYYQLIGSIDFALEIFTSAKMMDLEEINIKEDVGKFL